MKKILILVLLTNLCSFDILAQYKAIYKVSYTLDTAATKRKSELTTLYINANQTSYFFSQNFQKMDSLRKKIAIDRTQTQINIQSVALPKTAFKHFIEKQYATQEIKVFKHIHTTNYTYLAKNLLNWQLYADTLNIKNYVCNKATVKLEGREYTAWYTSEIPISDGPYKFWGLPGLILKIADTQNHYEFLLESFEKYTDNPPPRPYQDHKTFDVSYDEYKMLSKEAVENPFLARERQGGAKLISVNGEDPNIKLSKIKVNPLERF